MQFGDRVRAFLLLYSAQFDNVVMFQVLEVNGITLTNVTHDQAVKALQSNMEGVTMKVARVVNPNGTTELIEEIDLTRGPNGFGFSIAGGIDNPLAVRATLFLWPFHFNADDVLSGG